MGVSAAQINGMAADGEAFLALINVRGVGPKGRGLSALMVLILLQAVIGWEIGGRGPGSRTRP